VNADITNDEKKSQRCNVERIQFRSRDFVTVSHEHIGIFDMKQARSM